MFRNYDDRDKRRRSLRNATLAGTAGLLAAAFFTRRSWEPIAARFLEPHVNRAAAFLSDVAARTNSPALASIIHPRRPITSTTHGIYRDLAQYNSFVRRELPLNAQRNAAVERLVNAHGWSEMAARTTLQPSGVSYDLFRTPPRTALAMPWYRKHVLPIVQRDIPDIGRIESHLVDAIAAGRAVEENNFSEELADANRAMLERMLQRYSKPQNMFQRLTGARTETLGEQVNKGFIERVGTAFGETANVEDLWTRQQTFFRILNEELPMDVSQRTFAQAAFIAKSAGRENWEEVVSGLQTGRHLFGGTVVDINQLKALTKNALKNFSNEFIIPIAPGLGGISPLKLFPWIRSNTEKVAGTLYANTKHRELFEAAQAMGVANRFFNEEGVLQKDLHFVGNRILGLPGEWSFKDAQTGFIRDFSRIRNGYAQDARGTIRNWFGDSFIGKAMDMLGLDKQAQPSRLSAAASVIGRRVNRDSPKFRTHPINILQRIAEGSSDIDDVEGLLIALREQGRSLVDINPTELFSEDVRRSLPPGFARLIEEGFSEESLRAAFREIGEISNGELLNNARYFRGVGGDFFKGRETGFLGRRFVENEPLAMHTVVGKELKDNLFNIEPLLGEDSGLSGRRLLAHTMYQEIFAQIAEQDIGTKTATINDILNSVMRLPKLSEERKATVFGAIWGATQERAFYASAAKQQDVAEKIAGSIRSNVDIFRNLHYALEETYPELSSWTPVSWMDTPDIISDIYVTPTYKTLKTPIDDIRRTIASPPQSIGEGFGGIVSHISSILHGRPVWAGDAQNPNFLYHSGYRLNQMLTEVGLGLPDKDLETTGSIYRNLVLKRILPAYGAVEAWKYLNHASNSVIGFSPAEGLANIRAHYHLAASKGADILGITDHAKRIVELSPGLEQYAEPRSYKEQKDYINEGYEPVRAGRGWLGGTRTPFMGGKIRYWSPSWHQIATSGWQEAENVDYNTSDYWAHSIIPTPSHPFAPIRRLLDPYWFERKHSQGKNADRPYVLSGQGGGDPNTFLGNLWNHTLGALIKPAKVLHPEYMPKGKAARERGEEGTARPGFAKRFFLMFSPRGKPTVYAQTLSNESDTAGGGSAVAAGSGGTAAIGSGAAGYPAARTASNIGRASAAEDTTIPDASPPQLPTDWRRLPRKNTAAYAIGYTPYNPDFDIKAPTEDIKPVSPFSSKPVLKRISKQVEDILGLYGFISTSTGERFNLIDQTVSEPVIASADQATSWEGRWYGREWGGVGFDVNELFRRWLVHKDRNRKLYNPVPNTQAPWMPGPDSLIPMTTGDPYTAVPFGEVRVPGEAYERIHEDVMMPLFRTRASALGKSVEEIATGMLNRGAPLTDYGEYVTEWGTKAHRAIQKQWKQQGVLEAAERRMVNEENNISGHMDAILNIEGKRHVADIKTVGGEKFRKLKGPLDEHVAQVNFYLHELGIDRGQIYYVNRDEPTDEIKVYNFRYNPRMYRESVKKVKKAKELVVNMINKGEASRGELYDPVTRAEVLSNLQPWSTEYKVAVQEAREYIKGEDDPIYQQILSKRLQDARKRATTSRKQYQIHDYIFSKKTKTRYVRIKGIIDANTFAIEESKRPIRLAGVKVSRERIRQWMKDNNEKVKSGEPVLEAFYKSLGIEAGTRVKIKVSEEDTITDDTMDTVHAQVSTGIFGFGNLNKQLIRRGVGKEVTTDHSAAGVAARFSLPEKLYGRIWEKFGHLDTPWHRKFGAPASALEQYKRTQVYGTSAGDWAHPISTYLSPTVDALAGRNPIMATLSGAMIGTFFARSRRGKLIGGAIGGAVGFSLSAVHTFISAITGKPHIPRRVRKRREIEEYYDTLRYIKNKSLEQHYAKLEEAEGKRRDIDQTSRKQMQRGMAYAEKIAILEKQKERIKLDSSMSDEKRKKQIKKINAYIKGLQSKNRAAYPISENAALALTYGQKAKRTLYGASADPREALSGVPKYERELIEDIITNGTKQEKKELYALMPENQKVVFGKALGIRKNRIPTKKNLEKYFKTHVLPDASWAGWNPDFDLENARIIAAQEEGVNPIEMGIYPRNVLDAKLATEHVKVPTVHGRTHDVKGVLSSLLTAHGLHDVEVELNMTPAQDKTSSDIDVEIAHDRSDDYLRTLLDTSTVSF